MSKKELIKEILNNTYIDWLEKKLEQKEEVSNTDYSDNMDQNDRKRLDNLEIFFKELLLYQIEFQRNYCLVSFLKKGKNIYAFKINQIGTVTCKKYSFPLNSDLNIPIIDYEKFEVYLIEKSLTANLSPIIEQIFKESLKFYDEICYAMPLQERLLILRYLQNKSCDTCTNGSCNIESYEKTGAKHNCIGWFNPNLIGKSRVLAKLDINELKHS